MSEQSNEVETRYLVTRAHDDGEYSRHLDYLLADGTRRRVTLAVAHDSPIIRHQIGVALYEKHVEGKPWGTL